MLRHQPVQVRVLGGEATIRGGDGAGTVALGLRGLERGGELVEAGRNQGVLERLLVGHAMDTAIARAERAAGPTPAQAQG